MKLTKLQKNENIYKQIYFEVHKEVIKICEDFKDSDHLLLSRFNDIQKNPEEFKESFLELFYEGGFAFAGVYLKNQATFYYEDLEQDKKDIFQQEYVAFLKLFE